MVDTVSYTGTKNSEYITAYVKARRDKWLEENGPCQECGSIENLEVDHIDKTTKLINPSHIWTLKEPSRIQELAKCQVLCRDCHRKKTSSENTVWQHGTLSGYQRYKCRCIECKKFYRSYRRMRYQLTLN